MTSVSSSTLLNQILKPSSMKQPNDSLRPDKHRRNRVTQKEQNESVVLKDSSSRLNNQQTKKQIEQPSPSKEMLPTHNPNYGYGMPMMSHPLVQQPTNIFSAFNEELRTITTLESRRITTLTQLAKECHSKYALLVANALEYKITSGEYIRLFEERIAAIFDSAFENALIEEKRSLIKMFLIWDLFFNPVRLQAIRDRHQLQEYVRSFYQTSKERRLLSEADFDKVRRFRREFEPSFLPDEVQQSGRFVSGSESRVNVGLAHLAQGDPRMLAPNNMLHYGGVQYGTPQIQAGLQQHLQMPGYHSDLQTLSNIFPQKFSHSNLLSSNPTNIGSTDQRPPQTKPSSLQEMLNQITSGRNQPRIEPSREIVQAAFIPPIQPQPLPGGYYPYQAQNNGYNAQPQQMAMQYPPDNRQRNGYMFTQNALIDDNFHLKTDQTQFGFLPTILKSFQAFKSNQQLLLGQDQRLHGMMDSAMPPSFEKYRTLKELNYFAINEVYEGVKFQCAICGMRFIRNMMLKKHLDLHFNKNNEMRRKGNRAVSRPQFQNFKDFIQPRNSLANQRGGGQQGAQGQKMSEELVPYNNKETQCYICKEQFETIFDEEEESWYFVGAKQVRVTCKQSLANPKQIITVHTDCLKQIELNRDLQRQLKELSNNSGEESKQSMTTSAKTKEDDNSVQYQKEDRRIDIEELERQTRGIQSSKRQFHGRA